MIVDLGALGVEIFHPAETYNDWRFRDRQCRSENRLPQSLRKNSRRGAVIDQVADVVGIESDRRVTGERRNLVSKFSPTVPCSASTLK